MKKLLKWVVALVVLVVAGVVVVGLFLPSQYDIERSVTIDAPPQMVFRYLNDLEQWKHWEPFSESDVSIVTQRGVVTAGVGATQSWSGDSGSGSLTFTMADPAKGIAYDLDFDGYDPASAQMLFEGVDGKTVLTWSMQGKVSTPVVGGYFVLLLDAMIGPMYDDGLDNIKRVAEAEVAAGAEALEGAEARPVLDSAP